MSPEETASRSPLDKPLHQLTEEDISQLTREDCRRYLKEKGMRRPSWNKSQAIQQVISLKTLLETTPDSDAGGRKKLYIPRPENPHRVPKATSGSTQISASAEESVPSRREDPEKSDHSGDFSGRVVVNGPDSVSPRTASGANAFVGQMTIFYCGKVNVYDDMPAEKARALMQFAASPLQLPLEVPYDGSTTRQPLPCHLQAASIKVNPEYAAVVSPTSEKANMTDNCRLHREENGILYEDIPAAEGPGSRKASVQRYLEKKKDRFRSKRKVATPSAASLGIFLNNQMGNQTQMECSIRAEPCSQPHIRPSNTSDHCYSMENNMAKNANFSAGLNGKDVQE